MKDSLAVAYRADIEYPALVGNYGEALVVRTASATISGFFVGFTEGA